jgi:hypothetical protein
VDAVEVFVGLLVELLDELLFEPEHAASVPRTPSEPSSPRARRRVMRMSSWPSVTLTVSLPDLHGA